MSLYRLNVSPLSVEANGLRSALGKNPLRVIYSLLSAHLDFASHALSQVTNHAPSKPKSTPSSGLETANQKEITSLNGMAPRGIAAV